MPWRSGCWHAGEVRLAGQDVHVQHNYLTHEAQNQRSAWNPSVIAMQMYVHACIHTYLLIIVNQHKTETGSFNAATRSVNVGRSVVWTVKTNCKLCRV